MKTKLFSALAVALVSSAPALILAAPTFDEFSLESGGTVLDRSNLTPVSVGTVTSVNIAGTYTIGGNTFTIAPLTTGNARIFGNDSALDQISLTNSSITLTSGAPTDLIITYGFVFPLPANSQTYGLQAGGVFKRGLTALATGDTVGISSSPFFFDGETFTVAPEIDLSGTFKVSTTNTFGPLPPPRGVTTPISCSGSGGLGCTNEGAEYLFETIATIHFNQVGDSVRISNSFDAVSGEDPDAVQAQLDALAAADLAALPEPSVILLLLGSGFAGLGLHRLRHVRA